MCRLFGLHTGSRATRATFWLLDAPDNLAKQSHRNPDGAGIGTFDDDGRPVIDKQPMAAWDDADFAAGARDLRSRTFVAHVRYASTGGHTVANTHPFEQDGRLFAHNGAFEGLDQVDERLGELGARDLVLGDTDSERMFALITAETRLAGGSLQQGIARAVAWLADNVPVLSLNFVLTTPTDLWALRYPAAHQLHVLRNVGDVGSPALESRSDRIHAHSDELSGQPWVVVASEAMDDEPRWRELPPGRLIHVNAELELTAHDIRSTPPARTLTRADLTA